MGISSATCHLLSMHLCDLHCLKQKTSFLQTYASVYVRQIHHWGEKRINLQYQNMSSCALKHSVHLASE